MTVKSILAAAVLATAAIGASPASAGSFLPVDYYDMSNGGGTAQFGDLPIIGTATYSGAGNKTDGQSRCSPAARAF